MPRFVGNLFITCFLIAMLATALLPGCGGTRGRKVLSFFFDGVPPAGDSLVVDTSLMVAHQERERLEAQRQAARDSIIASNLFQMHPPYADGECTSCHNMPSSSNTSSGSSLPVLASNRAPGSGWLVLPVEELCIECHSDMSLDYAEENDLNIHGPVGTGECTVCHHPHRSRYEHLLLTESTQPLCFQCHEETIAQGLGEHPELESSDECTDCHNPHLSAEDYFLD